MQEGMPPLSITMIMSNQALGGRNPLFSKRGGEIAWCEGGGALETSFVPLKNKTVRKLVLRLAIKSNTKD